MKVFYDITTKHETDFMIVLYTESYVMNGHNCKCAVYTQLDYG